MLRNTPLFSRRNPEKEHRTIQSPNFRTLLRVTRLDPMFRIRHIAFRIRRIIFPIRHIFLRIRHIIFRRLLIPSPPPHSTLPTCLSMTHKRIVRLHLRAGLSKKKASVSPNSQRVASDTLALWTRRGLNPRPNGDTKSFLHAYLRLSFRVTARPEPPTATLSSKSFVLGARPPQTIPDIAAPSHPNASGTGQREDVSFQHLVSK